jgi:integrase
MSTFKVVTVTDRNKLKARRGPYWHRVQRGNFIGYRRMTPTSVGTWIARAFNSETLQQSQKALGEFPELPANERFDAAVKAAREWFDHLGRGGQRSRATVRDVCARYVEQLKEANRGTERTRTLRRQKDANGKPTPLPAEAPKTETYIPAADDAEKRFKAYVLNSPKLADTEIDKLTPKQTDAWRKSLADRPTKSGGNRGKARTASSLNRDMTPFRAALNMAKDDGFVMSDFAWKKALTPVKNADGRRDIYLDAKQRARLVESARPDVAKFLRMMSLLPLRPGALAALTVADFDKGLGVLRIGKDKAGADRKIKLPPSTAAIAGDAAKDKTPAAPLLSRADGTPWNKDAWKRPVKEAVIAAELPAKATAYALRHSVITDLVVGGLDLLTVALIAGTSVKMIEQHYGHLRADHAAAALAMLV